MALPSSRKKGRIAITVYVVGEPTYSEDGVVTLVYTQGPYPTYQVRSVLNPVVYDEQYHSALYLVNDGGDGGPIRDTLVYLCNQGAKPVTGYFEYFDTSGNSIFTDAVTVNPNATAERSVLAAVENASA